MLKAITEFLNARKERKLSSIRLALELIRANTNFMCTVSEIYIQRAQSKCLTCKHKYEKKEFETGGIVGLGGKEVVLKNPNDEK